MKIFTTATLALALAACGPSYAPLNAPATACPQISAEEFRAAVAQGAARATATINAAGMVSMETGPGSVHCATFRSTIRPCRRPNDFVIHYTLADGSDSYVRVEAGRQYRFRVSATPTTCEIVNE